MRRIIPSFGALAVPTLINPTPVHAQYGIGGGLGQQRLAQQAVIRWFQAYLGRLPNAQELAVLTNQYLLSGNAALCAVGHSRVRMSSTFAPAARP